MTSIVQISIAPSLPADAINWFAVVGAEIEAVVTAVISSGIEVEPDFTACQPKSV